MPVKDAPLIEAMKATLGAVSTLRLSPHAHLPAPRGLPARLGAHPPALAQGRAAAAATARGAGSLPAGPTAAAASANFVWAYDFVFDACANGQQIKCLTIVDEFTHECLAIDVAGRIRSKRVIEVLTRLISVHGAPRYLRSDNGPEFVSRAILEWLADERHRDGAHRSGQALAERHQRVLQRQVPRRVLDRSSGFARARGAKSSSKTGVGTSTQYVRTAACST